MVGLQDRAGDRRPRPLLGAGRPAPARRCAPRVFAGRVEIYRGSELVAAHARSYVRGESVLELAHYLDAFARKPRAALSCAALRQADPVFLRARDLLLREPDGHRRFAEILLLGRELGLDVLAAALRECLASGRLSGGAVRQLPERRPRDRAARGGARDAGALAAPADLARYDALLAVAR